MKFKRFLIRMLKGIIAFPFDILQIVFAIGYALSPIFRLLAIIIGALSFETAMWCLERGNYSSFICRVFFVAVPLFSGLIFKGLMNLCAGIVNVIYGLPFKRPEQPQAQSGQTVTLSMEQFKELLNNR